MTVRLILIGCSKSKKPYVRDAKRGGRLTPAELYNSQLFRKRVEYAERRGMPWSVLSAAFGVWPSNVEKNPMISGEVYDLSLAFFSPADRAAWHICVARDLVEELWEPYHVGDDSAPLDPKDMTVEIHAGRDYCHPLAEILTLLGVNVELPCDGLGIGQQLALYTSGALSAA